jgi:hypothetical protein
MAGGLFPNQPFAFNVKCIVFTAVVAGGYWFAPAKNVLVLLVLLWLPYVSMAWYDYVYQCNYKMQPTLFPFGRWIFLPFKPDGYKKEFERLPNSKIETMNKLDHTVAWTLLIALLAFGAWYLRKN